MGSGKPLIEPATAESMVAKRGTTTTNGAGDGSTVVDAGLTEANDYWNDMTLLILSGACDGQSRDITDFAGGTLTVSPVFANQILSGVRYFILPFKPSAAEVEDIKGTGFVKDTDSLVDLAHETDHDVPGEDSATDAQIRDVVGKKSDTVAGTSIVAISKQVKAKTDNIPASPAPANEYDTEMARITADVATEAKQDVIDGYHDVPGEDSATDAQIRDVVGKKTDTVAGTSIVAISKQVKAKTDNIPASPAPSGEYDTEMAYVTEAVATEAKQDIIDGLIDDIIADIGTFPTANYATFAAYVEDIRTRLIAIVGDTGELQTDWADGGRLDLLIDAIKAKTDILPATNTDESGSLTWVTLTHTTNEGDISALFSTALTGSTRRRYAVFIDLTGCEADAAAWTKCTVRVKIGFGVGDAYRTVDLKEIAKTDVAATAEPGVNIDVPATAKNVQITLQFDVQLNANATIYYSYVNEALE